MKTAQMGIKIAVVVIGAVGAIDLLLGNTGKSPLPDAVTNMLSQQTDLVLAVLRVIALIWL